MVLKLVALPLCLVVAACNGDHDAAPPVDAGDPVDGGRPMQDASRPTVDAGRDAAVAPDDGGALDAGDDEEAAEWVALEGLPDGCVVEWARQPHEVWTPGLEPCPEDEPCDRVVVNGLGFAGVTFYEGVGAHDGEAGLFWTGVDFAIDELRPKVLVASTKGRTYGAWRNARLADPGICAVEQTAVSATGRTVAWTVLTAGGPWARTLHVYHSDIDQLRRARDPIAVIDQDRVPGEWVTGALDASDAVVAVLIAPAARLYRVDVDTREVTLLTDGGDSMGLPIEPQVVGDDVYWVDWRGESAALLRSRAGALGEELLQDEGVFHLGAVVDGSRITWQRAVGPRLDGTFEEVELFTADLADDPLEPRSLGRIGGFSNLYGAGSGHYAFVWDGIEIVDVQTGVHRRFSLAPGPRVRGAPLYVTDTELMIQINLHDGDRGSAKRIDLARLPVVE